LKVNNSYIIIFIIIFSGILFSHCKKYQEDDVLIQWKKPEKRLIKFGPWVFEKLTVDGVDKSIEFKADSAYFDKIEFRKREKNESQYISNVKIIRTNLHTENGLFEIINDAEILKIGIIPDLPNETDFHNYGVIFISDYTNWNIIKLTKNSLKLKANYNSSEYILELKPE